MSDPWRDNLRREAVRRILASGAVALAARSAAAQKPAPRRRAGLPAASDLAADATASRRGQLPILLFFDRDDCPYCEQALREYLVPFSREEWKGKAIFRQVGIDRNDPVVDFGGAMTSHRALAASYGIVLSPTILVVDARGESLAEPIVGLLTVDFYGAYVHNALATAARKLRA